HSLPGVGYVFGGRHHTTVFRAGDKITQSQRIW
ncbi:hypothetical protein GHO34_27580, partial [Pseudomonas sp. FSL R10-2245]|nr:hypothetical protein [Pseudomonas sp. FSL R10-2245]